MNPLDVMRYGQGQIDALIDRLSADDWARVAHGAWTTKDLVGHLGAFELRFADLLAGFVGEPTQSGLVTANVVTSNDDQAAVRRDWSVKAILAEFRDAHLRVMTLAGRLPLERWREVGTIPWYGPEYALDDLLVYTMYGHKREHAPQLEAVLERPLPTIGPSAGD